MTDQLPIFLTKGGVRVVVKGGPLHRDGFWKVECYRSETGGRMGLLKVRNLTPISGAAKAIQKAAGGTP